MDRRIRITLLIFLLLVGVIVVAQFVVKPMEEEMVTEANETWTEGFIFPELVDKKVARYEAIQEKDGFVAYEKRDGRWWIVKPIEERGNHQLIQIASETILKIRWIRDDIEGGLKKPEFGLWPPRARLIAVTEDGTETPALLFGADASAPQQVYAAVEGRDKVYVVERNYFISGVRNLDEVRVSEILQPVLEKASRFREITLKSTESPTIEMVQDEAGWSLRKPEPMPLDDVSMADLFKKWLELVRPIEWLDDAGALRSRYGLDAPILSVEVALAPERPGEPSERTGFSVARIETGGVVDYYLQTDWYKSVYRIGEKSYRLLTLDLEKLIEKRPFPIDPERVREVRIESRDKDPIGAKRTSTGSWTLTPGGAEGSGYAIEKFIENAVGARALQTEAMDPETLAEKRLTEVAHKIEIALEDGTKMTALFGEDIAQGYSWCLYSRDPSRIYLVNQRTIDGWPKTIDDFKPLSRR